MRRCALALLLALLAASAYAGGAAPCKEPFIFNEARVNVVVLPYTYTVLSKSSFIQTGQELSLLVQMNTLSAILKYESVGAIDLIQYVPNDPNCAPEKVWSQLTRMAASRGNGLVLVWGRIFEDGDQIYEQTFVRMARGKQPPATWQFTLGGNTFSGHLSASGTAFPAQTFSMQDLARIAELGSKYSILRDAPNETAPGQPLARCLGCRSPDLTMSYVVLDQQGEWTKVRTTFGDTGWLKLDTGFGSSPLAEKMPELHFIDGAVGFLGVQNGVTRPAQLRAADNALARYVERDGRVAPVSAAALAQEMRGMLASHGNAESASRAVDLFANAVALRSDADAHNLLAMAKLQRWSATKRSVSQSEVANGFISAAVLDPSDSAALSNLKSFYSLALSDDPIKATIAENDRLSRGEAKSGLEMVNSILAKRAK